MSSKKEDMMHCCCPNCKRHQGIEKSEGEDSFRAAICSFCQWEGHVGDLLCYSEDFNYHDNEPGID